MDKLVTDNDIAFLKWDYNRNWSEPGWPEVAPDRQKNVYVDYTENLYSILREPRARHPKLEVESCSGGRGRVDLGILALVDQVWTSDNTDAFERLRIQDDFTQAYSPAAMITWVTIPTNTFTKRTTSLDYPRVLKILGLFCLLATPAMGQSWTLGNARVERTVTYAAGQGLRTSRLSSLDTRFDYIRGDEPAQTFAPEISFDCDGKTVSGADSSLQLIAGTLRQLPDGKSLTVTVRSPDLPLLIDVVYRIYDRQPATRKWLVLHNTGNKPLRVSHLKIEALAPSVGPVSEMLLNAQYGAAPRELLYTGRSEDAGLMISNSRTGDGFAILNEVPGYMKRTEVDRLQRLWRSSRLLAQRSWIRRLGRVPRTHL